MSGTGPAYCPSMTRHAVSAFLLVLILGACKSSGDPAAGKPAAGDDKSAAQPVEPPAEAKSATEPPSGEPPAEAKAAAPEPAAPEPAAEPAAADAGPATGAADSAKVEPADLVGHVGFNWLAPDPQKAKCVKLDDRMAKKLAAQKFKCRRRSADEGFEGNSSEWASCRAGKTEWMLYASKEVCQEQLETMKANGP